MKSRYAEADASPDVAGGGVMYKLMMRAFPGWYRANSAYALYPFTVPSRTKENFANKPSMPVLDFSMPKFIGPPTPAFTWKAVTEILSDQPQFRVPCRLSSSSGADASTLVDVRC